MDDLTQRIRDLPPELFNHILDFVVTINTPNNTITIDPSYHPPVQLHIARWTRDRVAQTYYSQTTFYIPELHSHDTRWLTHQDTFDWLRSLPMNHRQYLRSENLITSIPWLMLKVLYGVWCRGQGIWSRR